MTNITRSSDQLGLGAEPPIHVFVNGVSVAPDHARTIAAATAEAQDPALTELHSAMSEVSGDEPVWIDDVVVGGLIHFYRTEGQRLVDLGMKPNANGELITGARYLARAAIIGDRLNTI